MLLISAGIWQLRSAGRDTTKKLSRPSLVTTQQRNFPVMRGAPEEMPRSTRAHIRSTLGSALNRLDYTGAQHASTPHGGIWLVNGEIRGNDVTCMMQGGRGYFGCTTRADFAAHGLALGMASGGQRHGGHPRALYLLGRAPDWVKRVRVQIGHDRTQAIPVQSSIYALHSSDEPIFVDAFCSSNGMCRRR